MSQIHRRRFLTNSVSLGAVVGGALASSASGQTFGTKLPAAAPAVMPPPGIKTFSKLPRNANALAGAHLVAGRDGEATEFLLGGELLEFNGFAIKLTKRDGAPLNTPDPLTFYSAGREGYTDYPRVGEQAAA